MRTGRPRGSLTKRPWTEEEVKFLRENVNVLSVTDFAKKFNCCTQRVSNKIAQLQLRTIKHRFSPQRSFPPPRTPRGSSVEVAAEQVVLVSPGLPVPPAMKRLAEFDPVVARAMRDRVLGTVSPERIPAKYSFEVRKYG